MTLVRRFSILGASALALAVLAISPGAAQGTTVPGGPLLPVRVIDRFDVAVNGLSCGNGTEPVVTDAGQSRGEVPGSFRGAVSLGSGAGEDSPGKAAAEFDRVTIPGKLGGSERGGDWAHHLPVTAEWSTCSAITGSRITDDWPGVTDVFGNGNLKGGIQLVGGGLVR